jgi:hypothetical protein
MKTWFFCLALSLAAFAQDFPSDWWRPVPREDAASWEILPQDALPGEVILSKRTELGIFSNFGTTPFVLDGLAYASVEGLWQAMKYPDPNLPGDPRHAINEWPHTRAEVMAMTGFEAKDAGTAAGNIYKKYKLKNISYGTQTFDYKDFAAGSALHLDIISRALKAKLDQNPGLWELLEKTQCLRLRPDHKPGENDPPAYKYYDLFMHFRKERVPCSF